MTFDPNNYLIKVRGGGDYLEAKWRLVWLRGEHPNAIIETQHIDIGENYAIFRATVTIPEGGSATGYGSETAKDFGDFIEKAETKALARALAALGYGTQFTGDELAEGERIVDSPVQRQAPRQQAPPPQQSQNGQADMGGPPMTDRQRGFLISLAKELGMVSDNGHHDAAALDAEIKQFCGMTMDTLTVGAAKAVIEEFKARPKPIGGELPQVEPHPMVQQAMENSTANWIAAMEGAATMRELTTKANEALAANQMTDPVRAAFNARRDHLQEKSLVQR